MQSPSAFNLTAAAVSALGLCLAPGVAAADVKQECSAAYDETQALRTAGRLASALERARLCARDECTDFIQKDCRTWIRELGATTPTVVFAVKDAAGADTLNVRVSLDGRVLSETLDGKAVPIDPGAHKVRFELAGSDAIERDLVVLQGVRDRRVEASFNKEEPPPASSEPPVPPVETPSAGRVPTWAWGVGGAGLGATVLGAILIGIGVSNKGNLTSGSSDGDVTTINNELVAGGLIAGVGLVGVVAGIVGIATTPRPKTLALRFARVVTVTSAGLRLQGAF